MDKIEARFLYIYSICLNFMRYGVIYNSNTKYTKIYGKKVVTKVYITKKKLVPTFCCSNFWLPTEDQSTIRLSILWIDIHLYLPFFIQLI